MRIIRIGAAACGIAYLADVGAVPVTISDLTRNTASLWSNSALVNRHGDFTEHTGSTSILELSSFDSSLGTLLGVELDLFSVTSHPTRSVFLEDVSGLPVNFEFGAMAQDTERDLHGPLNLFAYYDASVAYRVDYRLRVDPLFSDLFAPLAAEAAFGSCEHIEDLFGDIGDTNPYCFAGNNGSPLATFDYSWGSFSGAGLSRFIGDDALRFHLQMDGDVFGHCDDDIGDYCRLNLAMDWDRILRVRYTYEPGVPDAGGGPGGGGPGGGGAGGDPSVALPEPGVVQLMGIGLAGALALRRRRAVNNLARRGIRGLS